MKYLKNNLKNNPDIVAIDLDKNLAEELNIIEVSDIPDKTDFVHTVCRDGNEYDVWYELNNESGEHPNERVYVLQNSHTKVEEFTLTIFREQDTKFISTVRRALTIYGVSSKFGFNMDYIPDECVNVLCVKTDVSSNVIVISGYIRNYPNIDETLDFSVMAYKDPILPDVYHIDFDNIIIEEGLDA